MHNDTKRLSTELSSIVSTLFPDVELMKLELRLEEVLTNYTIVRKSEVDLDKDIPENIELYLSSKKLEGLSSITLDDYRSELYLFSKSCPKATTQVTTTDIRAFLASQAGIVMSTTGKKLSVLKSFFGWLVKEEVLLRDPSAKINLPKTPKRLPKGLSIEELELVRESCTTLRQRALIEIFYSTGCRLSEIVNMNTADVNYQDMSVNVIGKGDKERTVYLSFKAIYHLNRYLKAKEGDSPALFVMERKPHGRLSNRAIQNEVDKIEKLSKLTKKLTPHVMRHTFASLAMDNGVDLADLQHLMGHSNPGTTLIYSQVSEERKRQAFKRFHVQ